MKAYFLAHWKAAATLAGLLLVAGLLLPIALRIQLVTTVRAIGGNVIPIRPAPTWFCDVIRRLKGDDDLASVIFGGTNHVQLSLAGGRTLPPLMRYQPIRTLELHGAHLEQFPASLWRLEELSFRQSKLSDTAFEQIVELPYLHTLRFTDGMLSPMAAAALARSNSIRTLDLDSTFVDRPVLERLCAKQDWRELRLFVHQPDKDVFEPLTALRDLEQLDLMMRHSASLSPLEKLPHLRKLSFRESFLIGSNFHSIARIPNLDSLIISGGNLVATSPDDLAHLRHVTTIRIEHQWFDGNLSDYLKVLPHAHIIFWSGSF